MIKIFFIYHLGILFGSITPYIYIYIWFLSFTLSLFVAIFILVYLCKYMRIQYIYIYVCVCLCVFVYPSWTNKKKRGKTYPSLSLHQLFYWLIDWFLYPAFLYIYRCIHVCVCIVCMSIQLNFCLSLRSTRSYNSPFFLWLLLLLLLSSKCINGEIRISIVCCSVLHSSCVYFFHSFIHSFIYLF